MSPGFRGARVASFEKQGAEEMTRRIEEHGGTPWNTPATLEIPRQRDTEALGPDLPEDPELKAAVRAIAAGNVDYALFTSPTQVRYLLRAAGREGMEGPLRDGFRQVCIASIGPGTSEAISECGMKTDFEADLPHRGELIRGLARRGADLLEKKRASHSQGVDTNRWRRVDAVWHRDPDGETAGRRKDSPLLKACRREKTPYTPIWLMRQAGRYQREYRQMRATVPFLEMCKTPDLAAEVTLMAVDRLGVDAAILFADILLVLEPMGAGLRYARGDGPVIDRPIRTRKDVEGLREVEIGELGCVFEATRIIRRALRPDLPLIGFAGAPFTVASYLVEGSKSRHFEATKALMHGEKGTWEALMDRLVRVLGDYLNGQVAAGADAVQVFDSWVGCLAPDDYREFVLPHTRKLIGTLRESVPVIHFATGNPSLLELLKEAGGDVIGLDWRVDLREAWGRLGDDVAVMGNLDPTVLLAPPDEIRRQAGRILEKAGGKAGHIFNLGHGILPNTPPGNVAALVDAVHELSAR